MIKNRKHFFDKEYFKKVDKPDKAYFLGLLYADGYIYSKDYTKISLREDDAYILEEFSMQLKGNKDLYTRKAENFIGPNGNPSFRRPQRILQITCSEITNDLVKLGMTRRKSLSLEFPKVKGTLLGNFIRGYFDGDGYVEKTGRRVIIAGSHNFCKTLSEKLYTKGITSRVKSRGNISIVEITHSINLNKLYLLMYDKAKIFLKRKEQILEKHGN